MNKKMKLLSVLGLVTAILFLFSPMVTAQSLSISGKVIDKNRPTSANSFNSKITISSCMGSPGCAKRGA